MSRGGRGGGGGGGIFGGHESIESSFRLVDAVSSIPPPLPLKLNTILAVSYSSNYSSLSLKGLLNNTMSQIISWGSMPPDSTGILMHYTRTENCVQYCLLYQSPLLASQARPSMDCFQYHAWGRKGLVTLGRFPCAHGMQ